MVDTDIRITKASVEDAPFIAQIVMGAIGHELCVDLAGGEANLSNVVALFTRLAASVGSQYSYKNTLIAKNSNGLPVAGIIAYDGARLHEMRPEFIAGANELLGWNVTEEEAGQWEDETSGDEYYLDSLFVCPGYRGQGLARLLINEVISSNKHAAKPFGLLVEPENETAKNIYQSMGFEPVGVNRFCGVPMTHMQLSSQ